MHIKSLGGLSVQIVGGPNRNGGGAGPMVVLLHGFGAPGDDLVSLWKMIRVPNVVRFVFPAAPLTLNGGLQGGRAWWMLDMERIARDMASGRGRDVHAVPQGLSEARASIVALLDELKQQWNTPSEHIILGGFSQGAMLACDTVLRTDRPFGGLILLSGSLIAKDEWIPAMSNRKGLPVFQSHGTDDPLLSCDTAKNLRNAMVKQGLSVEWHEFRGGHEIPFGILERLGLFLQTHLKISS
jgi:phospholipase/carboxylesterase